MTKPTTPLTIPHAYHALLKAALHATSFSSPARYTIHSTLRRSFRLTTAPDQLHPRTTFDPARICNTLHFLELAALPRSLEGRVLKSLLHTWWWQDVERGKGRRAGVERLLKEGEGDSMTGVGKLRTKSGRDREEEGRVRARSEKGFEMVVAGLNESMGLCLPVR